MKIKISKKFITIGITSIVMWWAIVLWFNYFGDTQEAQLRGINNEITMLETQMLQNKAEWTIRQNRIDKLKTEQKTYTEANNELRKQKQELLNEKKKLGLN